jgi:hypothetical protein
MGPLSCERWTEVSAIGPADVGKNATDSPAGAKPWRRRRRDAADGESPKMIDRR